MVQPERCDNQPGLAGFADVSAGQPTEPESVERPDSPIDRYLKEAGVFDIFTKGAREALDFSMEEARLDHAFVGTEHILLGLLRQGGNAGKALLSRGVEIETIRSHIALARDPISMPIPGELALTPRAKKVIEGAPEEAQRINREVVDTEVLLLAVARKWDCTGATILENLGLGYFSVRDAVEKTSPQTLS